jgi:hypothetical protein
LSTGRITPLASLAASEARKTIAAPAGRPPPTGRRKAATRREIAHEAVRLFGERGVVATTGEETARAAGAEACRRAVLKAMEGPGI